MGARSVSEHALFDAEPFGPDPRPKRVRKPRPQEVRLAKPWVLLGGHLGARAHLLSPNGSMTKEGALHARCGHSGYRINVEGHPMALVCGACWNLNR